MAVIKVEHPLIEDALSILRDAATPHEDFRRLTKKLSSLLVFEASRDSRSGRWTSRRPSSAPPVAV